MVSVVEAALDVAKMQGFLRYLLTKKPQLYCKQSETMC